MWTSMISATRSSVPFHKDDGCTYDRLRTAEIQSFRRSIWWGRDENRWNSIASPVSIMFEWPTAHPKSAACLLRFGSTWYFSNVKQKKRRSLFNQRSYWLYLLHRAQTSRTITFEAPPHDDAAGPNWSHARHQYARAGPNHVEVIEVQVLRFFIFT